ncbi:BON domain-containing protein [Perlucidibaca aquatica]|uniref:BON domain-containing protein n=1 Tax=Perlucidibaca aquatica TaxID=1852776 RepID=UPI00083A40D3|nr:BON domain-containing protein [Perlucidibaca aquatica]
MLNLKRTRTFTALALATTVLAGCTTLAKVGVGPSVAEPGTRTTSSRINDFTLAQSVRVDVYKMVPAAKDARIEVVSFYQSVLLVGEVPNADIKAQIGAVAKRYTDVKVVHNELSIGLNRSISDRLGDDLLERKANFSLLSADGLRSSQATVTAINGTLYLMGKLTQRETDRAIVRLQALDGVTRIVKIVDILPDTAS